MCLHGTYKYKLESEVVVFVKYTNYCIINAVKYNA